MNGEKFLIILFVLITFLLSVGGVFAEDIHVNESVTDTSLDDALSSQAVLTDESLYVSQDNEVKSSQDIVANFTVDVSEGVNNLEVNFNDTSKGNATKWFWDFGDGSNSTDKNPKHTYNNVGYYNVTLTAFNNDSSDTLVKSDLIHVYWDRDVIVNPDFDLSLKVGWDYKYASVKNSGKYADKGKRYLSLTNNGYVSQVVNLGTVDYISFGYMSEGNGATIEVLLDDASILNYTLKSAVLGNWTHVSVDVTNYTGFHTLKLIQKINDGYVDNFTVVHNCDIDVNFTLTDYSLVGDNLTLSFNDCSYGVIDGWLWDFGDGNTSTLQNVTHSYKAGHYTISLTVHNKDTTEVLYYESPITLPTIERTGVEYSTVQSAIDNAIPGDVIIIDYNIFYNRVMEDIVVDKNLTLDFSNCTLLSGNKNPSISVINGANVILRNIVFDNSSLVTRDDSRFIITQNVSGDVILSEGNFELENCSLVNANVIVYGDCEFNNCMASSSSIFINEGKSRIHDCNFTGCDVALTQTGGELELTSNIISNNRIGFNFTGGICNASLNAFFQNNISLVYNSTNINYDNNWWGKNKPVYIYSLELVDCDVLQLGGVRFPLYSWLVLNIAQSHNLDYDYWIAGITYYNLTLDLTHNNFGDDVSNVGHLNNIVLNITSVENHVYYERHSYYGILEKLLSRELSFDGQLSNGVGESIISLGYLTSDLSELNLIVSGENYTIHLSNNAVSPNITYITPNSMFDDNLTVEMDCNGSDAVIFYTLDGTNPGYSPTRLVYTEPFAINQSCTVHYAVIDKWGNFQRVLLDSINHFGGVSFIKQDVYVVLRPEQYNTKFANVYYSVDGSTAEHPGCDNFDGLLYYYHPFVIQGTAEINSYCELMFEDYFDSYLNNERLYMYCYSFDFSVNYLKNSSFNSSDAIWSQYQGDINNTGVTNHIGPLMNQSSWINNNVISSGSAVVDSKGHIIVGGSDGYLYYLNNQGLVIWRFGTTSRIICTPTIGADGNIYFSNWMNSTVYCISPEGQLIWKYNLGDYNTGTSPVFGLDNRLYVISSNSFNSTVHVFKDGVLLDNHTVPFISGSTPVVSKEGLLYLVSAGHELVILNYDGSLKQAGFIDSGEVIPSYYIFKYQQNTQISVSIDDNGIVYVLNYPRHYGKGYNAFYPNGTLKWSSGWEDYLSGTPSYYEGVLYITGNDNLMAVNASNGHLLWKTPISHSGLTASSPLVSGDEVLYVTSNNMVYAFNLSGDLIWQYELVGKYGNPISYASPTLTGDKTLIVTTNQGIYAFRDIAADFTYHHVNGTETTIQFTDLSTNGTNRYLWLFGDNSTSLEQNPVHKYNQSGKYRVTLFVEHNGNVTLARNTTIEVVFHDITPPSNVDCYINTTLITGGVFNQTQVVTLNASDEYSDVTIFYTVDGSNPLNSSTRRVYKEFVEIEVNTVLNMVARDAAGNYGNVSRIAFMITDVINVNDEVNSTLINDIQALLDNAPSGSKILFDYVVLKGANFTINKPLNIISNNNTILEGNGNQSVFTFTENATGSILNGFIINNTNTGVLIRDADNVLIRNCLVNVSEGIGINVINSINTTIKSTDVTGEEGIVVNKSDSTLLDSVHVSDCYSDGIWICQSKNTEIINSIVEDNGKDPYKLNNKDNRIEFDAYGQLRLVTTIPASQSRANNILIDDSSNTRIINNTVNRGFFGIHLYHTTNGVVIENNTVYECVGDAVLLSNEYYNVNITHNLIDGCYNGVDFMGYSQNILIKENTIENLHEHDNDLYFYVDQTLIEQLAGYIYESFFPIDQFYNHCYNGFQVSYPASNFHEGNVTIVDNVVIKLSHRSWEARKYQYYIDAGCDSYGYNLMDGSASYQGIGGATQYREGKVDLVVDRIGDATFRLRLINRLDNHYLSNIPSFNVTFTTGGFTQTVQFINDSAVATFDVAMALSDIEAIISTEIRKSAHFDIEITEGFNSSNRESDPGYEEGEAINNPDPVIPSFDELIDKYYGDNTNPVSPEIPEVEPSGIGNGTGDGIGNGTGSGNSTGNGTGTGTGNGNSTGTGNATGDNTSDNGTGDGNSDVTNPDNQGSTPGNNPEEPSVNPDAPDEPVDNPETPENPVNETNNNTVETPEIPDEPVNETNNNTVETPEVPEEPVNETNNNTVETPEVPDEPVEDNNNTVETPEVPEEPVNETNNNTVETPEVSDNPVNETNNSTVETPEIPEEPVDENNNNTQVNQDVPVDSGDEPETPANSGDNSEVIENTEPVTPSDSEDTGEVIESSEPVTPSASGEAIESNQQVTPVSPQELEVSEVSKDSSSSTSRGESSASSDSSVGPQGGSTESGGAGKAYEVSKVIDLEKSSWQIVGAVVLFAIIIILGYGYRWGKKDGDDF